MVYVVTKWYASLLSQGGQDGSYLLSHIVLLVKKNQTEVKELSRAGFLPGIFSRGQNLLLCKFPFAMLIFLLFPVQILGGRAKVSEGEQTA